MSSNPARTTPSRRQTIKALGATVTALGLGSVSGAADSGASTVDASITFTDQSPHHGTVYISEVTLPDDGFVALHDASMFTEGPVIGVSAPLQQGTYTNLPVEFSTYPDDPLSVAAIAHQDTPSDGVSTFPDDGDRPFVVDGDLIQETARVTPE